MEEKVHTVDFTRFRQAVVSYAIATGNWSTSDNSQIATSTVNHLKDKFNNQEIDRSADDQTENSHDTKAQTDASATSNKLIVSKSNSAPIKNDMGSLNSS